MANGSILGSIGDVIQGFSADISGQGQSFRSRRDLRRLQSSRALSTGRKTALAQDALSFVNAIQANDLEGADNLLTQRIDLIGQLGGDPTDTLSLQQKFRSGDLQGALADGLTVVEAARTQGFLPQQEAPEEFTLSPGQRRFAGGREIAAVPAGTATGRDTLSQVQSSQILPDGSTVQVFKDGSTRVTGPQGKVLKGQDRQDAVEVAQEFGIDVQSRRAGGRTGATQTEKRAGELITRGISAAESTATIRRAISLLDRVKTGGIQAISLATMQRLGIEGADEGELSNSLGKSVLSQLRETFGAAFTQTEGERLERIEAGFGKSTESNRRLLGQALRIAERTANRAIKAAKSRGSQAEVADIEDLLSFKLGIDEPGQPPAITTGQQGGIPQVTTQAQFDALPPGATFTENGEEFRKP